MGSKKRDLSVALDIWVRQSKLYQENKDSEAVLDLMIDGSKSKTENKPIEFIDERTVSAKSYESGKGKNDLNDYSIIQIRPKIEEVSEDTAEDKPNYLQKGVSLLQKCTSNIYKKHASKIKKTCLALFIVGFLTYLGFAIHHNLAGATGLIVVTGAVVVCLVYRFIRDKYGRQIANHSCVPIRNYINTKWKYFKWVLWLLVVALIVLFLVFQVKDKLYNWISLLGMVVLLSIAFITSKHPTKVKARPIIWGLALQFALAYLILKWRPGYIGFKFLADNVKIFLDYVDVGCKFMFGDAYMMHPMIFKMIPTILFFGSVMNVLMYLGVIQVLIEKIAWLMQMTMATTAIESFNAAASIFFSLMENSTFLRHYVHLLTLSEIFAIEVASFATVAGFVLAIFVELGAPAEHVMSAAIMSAPAAMVVSKINYPETEATQASTDIASIKMQTTSTERNVFEAAANGAIAGIKMISHCVASILAFMGLMAFVSTAVSWLGARVGYPELSFSMLCGYLFLPLTLLIGVEPADAFKVADYVGTKLFVDLFVAYGKMGAAFKNGEISERSAVLATYCLCGFSSIVGVGLIVTLMTAITPSRRSDFSEMAMRAFIMSNISCFLTACLAGILYEEGTFADAHGTNFNATTPTMNVTFSIK